jgi:low affinity Fe/Cu permease
VQQNEVRVGRAPARDPSIDRERSQSPPAAVTNERFRHFATQASHVLGSPWSFAVACLFVLAWALSGPYFDYSDGWQLVINTSTTIGTFLMVFLLQNTQNRDTKAINVKLDELLRAIEGARTGLADIGDLTDEEVDRLEGELVNLARKTGVGSLTDKRERAAEGGRSPRSEDVSGQRPAKT